MADRLSGDSGAYQASHREDIRCAAFGSLVSEHNEATCPGRAATS